MKIPFLARPIRLGGKRWLLPILLVLGACTGEVGGKLQPGTTPGGGGAGSANGSGGASGSSAGPSYSGASGSGVVTVQCNGVSPGPAPLIRRLTTYEYNNTVRDLLGDKTSPGSGLAPQVDSKQNTFGNDAANQFPTPLAIADYQTVAESVAARATADSTALGNLNTCASKLTTATEAACARTIASSLGSAAYRRVLTSAEVDELVALYTSARGLATTVTFGSGVAAMIEAILQSPEFLYRVELGTPVPGNPAVERVAGREMAARLSYLFWQTMPDPQLFQVADSGMLDTNEGVQAQARKMLDDPRSHQMMAFFFDNLLPIADLNGLTRNSTLFPNWSSSIGAAMRTEVQRMLEYEIYENTTQPAGSPYAPGSWQAILTAPYTFVNETLFNYYGASNFAPGVAPVKGAMFTKVELNTNQRLGLLTTGGITAGNTISDISSPVRRGGFIINNLMCKGLSVPTGLVIKPVDPYGGKTARIRFGFHESQPVCASCHKLIDPLGFPFENYDAVGMYRTAEHWVDPTTQIAYDTPIDSSGQVLGVSGAAKDGIELVKLLATSPDIGDCFAQNWMVFGYGRSLALESADSAPPADACNKQSVAQQFAKTGFKVKELLLAMTQSDGFLYRSAQ
ncbi:MAG: DUF1592 domain-containing protein [Pseudomonadota bacterium]